MIKELWENMLIQRLFNFIAIATVLIVMGLSLGLIATIFF